MNSSVVFFALMDKQKGWRIFDSNGREIEAFISGVTVQYIAGKATIEITAPANLVKNIEEMQNAIKQMKNDQ